MVLLVYLSHRFLLKSGSSLELLADNIQTQKLKIGGKTIKTGKHQSGLTIFKARLGINCQGAQF